MVIPLWGQSNDETVVMMESGCLSCGKVIDTPGILDHPLEDRNTIEMQAVTALAHLRAAVLYFMDISELCGNTIEQQVSHLVHLCNWLFYCWIFCSQAENFSATAVNSVMTEVCPTYTQILHLGRVMWSHWPCSVHILFIYMMMKLEHNRTSHFRSCGNYCSRDSTIFVRRVLRQCAVAMCMNFICYCFKLLIVFY